MNFVVKTMIRLYNYIAYNKYITKNRNELVFWQGKQEKNIKAK